jgi:hypothetical protein
MTSEQEECVHIYLRSDGDADSKVIKGASPHERYIIMMNDSLQKRNEKQISTIKELEAQVAALEEETDSYDSRRNYIKGLLKNFHEMHKWNEEIATLEQKMKKDVQTYVKFYKSRAAWHSRVLHAMFIVIMGLAWEFTDVWDVTMLGSILAVVVAFQYSMLQNLILPTFPVQQGKVKKLTTEKNKVSKAQDYIHEFIESQ